MLITAGPTREPIDPVRFISNRSSGKMGYALAAAAVARGHETVLVTGPVSLQSPAGAEVVQALTAEDMRRAVRRRVRWCDALIMAAAVCDWRPARAARRKLKKRDGLDALRLEPTPDILRSVRALKGGRVFVGFAAETHGVVAEAERKRIEKGLDLVVANDVSRRDAGFETDTNRVTLIDGRGAPEAWPLMSKRAAAARIVRRIETRWAMKHRKRVAKKIKKTRDKR